MRQRSPSVDRAQTSFVLESTVYNKDRLLRDLLVGTFGLIGSKEDSLVLGAAGQQQRDDFVGAEWIFAFRTDSGRATPALLLPMFADPPAA